MWDKTGKTCQGPFPNIPINCAAIDTDGSAYVGTDLGIFYRSPSMNDWIPFSNHLPVVPVTDIILYNSTIRVSTFGRGVWQSVKPTTCSIGTSITGDLIGDQYHEASLSIISTANVVGGAGTWVAFKAGDFVRLDPGFDVTGSNTFKAYIGDCASGGIPD
jgi:hypothetical protein